MTEIGNRDAKADFTRETLQNLTSIESAIVSAARPGQSNECTNLEYPVGVYYDFYERNWFYKNTDKIVNASSWLVDPDLEDYNPYMNDIVQVIRKFLSESSQSERFRTWNFHF